MTSTDAKINLSLVEFLELPETEPASEYINGKIYQKPMPQGKHSTLQGRFTAEINQVASPQQLAYAFPELRCTFGGRSIVPDIAVFEWQRIPLNENGEIKNRFETYPDWVIEILSPEQHDARLTEKIIFCLNHGTKLGWLIDPEARLVIVFKPKQQPEVKKDSDILPVLDILDNWQLSAAELFQWLSFRRN
ncbi:Uma2 family endonuclease [Lyngbya aestuarii]|uniref:Uma2 family endonuclease n=1 Tax=Lyngbya aestuarii TaxID=118322 RepID=UPI00403DB351